MHWFGELFQVASGGVVRRWIPDGARVLDLRCHNGEFLRSLSDSIGPSVGFDPRAQPEVNSHFEIVPERFTPPSPYADAAFDVVVLPGGVESTGTTDALLDEYYRLLRPGGRVILTLPSRPGAFLGGFVPRGRTASVSTARLAPTWSPRAVPGLFANHGFALENWQLIQLGMVHLLVFRKPLPAQSETPPVASLPTLQNAPAHA